jgi:hypothetical protein
MKKNNIFLMGMAVLVLSSLVLTGCGDGGDGGGGGGNNGYDPVVTITGLPSGSYNVYVSNSYSSNSSGSYYAQFQVLGQTGPTFNLISVGGGGLYESPVYFWVILTKSDETLIGAKDNVLFTEGQATLEYSSFFSGGGAALEADIDQSLIGTWKDNFGGTPGDVLTINITSTTITWGGSAGTGINNATNAYNQYGTWVWIVKNGKFTIKYTYSGQTTSADVYTYSISGSTMTFGAAAGGPAIATLTKTN